MMDFVDTQHQASEREGLVRVPAHPDRSDLVELVRSVFAAQGALSGAVPQFANRAGQVDMAVAVAEAVRDAGVLVVEAGTGVGKTFAYLVPALLSGERVLLSTATKTLQDQLFGRDIPHLVASMGLAVRTALLKGRSSYICLHRLELARHDVAVPDRNALRALARVEQWAAVTRSGDLAEVAGLDERSPLIPLITSTRENCLGSVCPKFKACHVNLARREALAADVVVINHHLFFADMAVRESGMAELLPSVRVVVFDEAHQLNETGVQFLGTQFTTGQLLDFARDTLACGLQFARGMVDWQKLASRVELAGRDLRLVVGRVAPGGRIRWTHDAPQGVDPSSWMAAMDLLQVACEEAVMSLDSVAELAPDFARLQERGVELVARAQAFRRPAGANSVRWVEAGVQLRLVESPLDIAEAVQNKLLDAHDSVEGERSGRTWVFTSATLGDDARLRWFTEPCGLTGERVLRVDSPFDFEQQACLFVPDDLPRPQDERHSAEVARLSGDAAVHIGGRTMVLTTTLRALRAIGEALNHRFSEGSVLEVLVQGQAPKRELIERFREGAGHGRPGCVLVASASFWEGIDVPGDALQLVVIDKLPFPPPNDPLVEARAQRLEANGRSPFNDYFLAEAAVTLKQGAGRLIRRESDRGVLVVCDTRLGQMGYGRRLLAALPPMRRLLTREQFEGALQALTRASTTDPDWP